MFLIWPICFKSLYTPITFIGLYIINAKSHGYEVSHGSLQKSKDMTESKKDLTAFLALGII